MSCPVCLNPVTKPALTGSDRLFESTTKSFTLNSCGRCDSLFLNPMPRNEEMAAFYPFEYWWNSTTCEGHSSLRKFESLYRKLALRDHIAFISHAGGNRRGLDLLDVGCGGGTLLALLKRRAFRPVGIDVSVEAARIAEKENGVRVIAGSLSEARFPGESFDIVTLFHVMEHIPNPRDVLAEVFRIVKPNGSVILQVPNIHSWQFKAFGAKWYGLDVPRHVIDYSKKSMLRLLHDTGFVPRRIKHFNLRDNAPALVSSLFPSLDPVGRTVRHRNHGVRENVLTAWSRHTAYLSFVICAYPITLLEAAFGRGATVMIEARKANG